MPRGQWTLVACDGSGSTLADVTTRASGVSFTFTRNGVPECGLSLSHDDQACTAILTALANGTGGMMPTLKAYRDSGSGKVLRFNGYLAGISEESGTESSTASFTYRGAFGRSLGDGAGRGSFITSAAALNVFSTDAGQIAAQLLTAGASSQFGINIGTVEATVNRDRSYPNWTNVAQAIVDLTNILNGFDFEVPPSEGDFPGLPTSAGASLNVYAQQGSVKSNVKFEYGPTTLANCTAMHRQTLPPINQAQVPGVGGALSGFSQDAPSITKYGRWQVVVQAPDVLEQATLDDKADALLRPDPVTTIAFTPDPALAPSPWDDYWIGDSVQFYASRNALIEGPTTVRVNQIRLVIDPDSGYEAAEIEQEELGPNRSLVQVEVE